MAGQRKAAGVCGQAQPAKSPTTGTRLQPVAGAILVDGHAGDVGGGVACRGEREREETREDGST